MSERLAKNGAPNDDLVRLYQWWSAGGAALLISGNIMVDASAIGESGNVVIEDHRHKDALARWSGAVHESGSLLWAQINHPGRQAPTSLNKTTVAPSAVAIRGIQRAVFGTPQVLTSHQVTNIIARFANTAEALVAGGFDGIQIHAAHGYLISQFLSPLTNQRTDEWGGDAERRMCFLLSIARAVRARVGDTIPIGVKLNSADFQRGGFNEEESMAVIAALEQEGIDMLEISGGTYEAAAMFDENPPASSRSREAFFLDYAHKARSVTRLPILLTGGFRTLEGMNQALASGGVDLVGLARPLAVEPDLPARLLSGAATRAECYRLATGWRALDNAISAGFYQTQIHRLAFGMDPSASMSRWTGLLHYAFPMRAPSTCRTDPRLDPEPKRSSAQERSVAP